MAMPSRSARLPAGSRAGSAPVRRDGYTLMWATLEDQNAAIVSDLDGEELARLRALLAAK